MRRISILLLIFLCSLPAQAQSLSSRLDSILNGSRVVNRTTSLQIVELESGSVVAERNPRTPVAPASNLKLFTTAAALDLLGADFEFVTTIAARGEVDAMGNLAGDVKIVGRGDPTIGSRMHDGDPTKVIRQWVAALKKEGIRTIRGDLIFEYGYFDTEYVHPTWPEDQLVNWYEAPISALAIQEGCVVVRVTPGPSGGPANVELVPANDFLTLEHTARTAPGRGAFIGRKPGTNTIIVRGNVPPRTGPTEVYVTVMYPLHYFGNVVHRVFEQSGLHVEGKVVLASKAPAGQWRTVAEHRTPLSIVNFVINKKSQNHYAEQLFKALGAEKKGEGSWATGSEVISEWMTSKLGVPSSQFSLVDGSGMSRFNRASAHSFIEILRYMWGTPQRQLFVSSMPFSGESDSRLRRRLNQPPYARQVYAKTGYISGVIGLSGYVHAQSGKIYAFSFLFNDFPGGVWGVYQLQDELLKTIITHG